MNSLARKPFASRVGVRFSAVILVAAMLVGVWACSGQEPTVTQPTAGGQESIVTQPAAAEQESPVIEPVIVERELEPEALRTVNAANALALKYYIYARLKTEELLAADTQSMPEGAFVSQMDELVTLWETADALAAEANALTDQAIMLLGTPSAGQATLFHTQLQQVALVSRDIDPETWAENLSKQYDALRGAQRHKQLAQQLGADTKTAVEQMALAQKILHNAADVEEAQAEVNAYTRSINIVQGYKTASKVGLFIGAAVATGGGSLASLAGGSATLGQAGVLVVGGVDCIVDVGATTSSIVLGEDHRVTVGFQEAGDVIQPVSMVLGLVTLDPGQTEEMIALVGESMMEWFYPGKITALGIEPLKAGGTRMIARIINTAGEEVPGIRSALEKIGLSLPSEAGISVSELTEAYTIDSKTAQASMQTFVTQIAALSGAEEPQGGATGATTAQGMAGTWSGSATLQHVASGAEAEKSVDVTLQLGEDGTGTATVYGYSGEAWYGASTVGFSVTMKEGGWTLLCEFSGSVTRTGGQIVIDGTMTTSIKGIEVATYGWTAQR